MTDELSFVLVCRFIRMLAAADNVAASCRQCCWQLPTTLLTAASNRIEVHPYTLLYTFFNSYSCFLQATRIEEECSLVKKSLLFEGFEETLAHRLAIFLGIANVGENLG